MEKLLVIGNKEYQRQAVLRLGVPENAYCDSQKQKAARWIMEQTGGSGVNVFFECVGKNETYEFAIESMAVSGRVILVGNPFTDMNLSRNMYWKILRNQLVVTGSWNSSFLHTSEDDWHYALKRLSEKKIRPTELITHRMDIKEMEKGFHMMRDKIEGYVKIMGSV